MEAKEEPMNLPSWSRTFLILAIAITFLVLAILEALADPRSGDKRGTWSGQTCLLDAALARGDVGGARACLARRPPCGPGQPTPGCDG
jgi:hypothetical protein